MAVRSSGRRLLALTLAVLALTLLAVAGHRTVRDVGPLAELAEARAVVTVVGVIATEPVVIGGPLVAAGADAPAGTRNRPVTPSSWSGWTSGRWRAAAGQRGERALLVTGDRSWAERSWHEEVEAVVRLSAAGSGR